MAASRQESVGSTNDDFTGLDGPFIDPTQFSEQLEDDLFNGAHEAIDFRDKWSGLPKMPSCIEPQLAGKTQNVKHLKNKWWPNLPFFVGI